MSTQLENQFMLIFRGTDWYKRLSPEEMQTVAEQWLAWFNRLTGQGKVVTASPLDRAGKVVSRTNGFAVSDGPFLESLEAVEGYLMLQANSLDEALAIAKEFPGLSYGAKVEVRPVAGECPLVEA